MALTQEELARAVAADMGGDVAAETEKELRGEGTRGFGIAESVAIGAFIAQTAQLAIQLYQLAKDRQTLVAELETAAPSHARLDEAKRRGIIARIAAKLTGAPQS